MPLRRAAEVIPSATVVLPTPPLRLSTATVCTSSSVAGSCCEMMWRHSSRPLSAPEPKVHARKVATSRPGAVIERHALPCAGSVAVPSLGSVAMWTDTGTARGSGAVWRALQHELARARPDARVVDVGGGSGVWAVPLAAAGCLVTVVEPNPNALATLRLRAQEKGVLDRITVVADDTDSLGDRVPAGSADLVLAHGLLEVVDDPGPVVTAL